MSPHQNRPNCGNRQNSQTVKRVFLYLFFWGRCLLPLCVGRDRQNRQTIKRYTLPRPPPFCTLRERFPFVTQSSLPMYLSEIYGGSQRFSRRPSRRKIFLSETLGPVAPHDVPPVILLEIGQRQKEKGFGKESRQSPILSVHQCAP